MGIVAEFNALEFERKRIAKELHDEVLPTLARLARFMQSQSRFASSTHIANELFRAIAAIRDILAELHPVDLEELGLVAALHNICQRYTRLTGRCLVFIEKIEELELPERQQLYLYRAVQAALRMFCATENDILLLSCEQEDQEAVITIHCVDKQVRSSEWLQESKRDAEIFSSCCSMANARINTGTRMGGEFPLDLIIAVTAVRETSSGMEFTWRDELIEPERAQVKEQIYASLMPLLNSIIESSGACDEDLSWEIAERLARVEDSIAQILDGAEPLCISHENLIPSLSALTERFSAESKIPTELVLDLPFIKIDLCVNTRFALYRIAQEALHNIEKHSKASRARVSIREFAGIVHMSVEDDGCGFTSKRNTNSRGIKNIKDRASAIGATVNWTNAVSFPTGTMLSIAVNLNSISERQAGFISSLR